MNDAMASPLWQRVRSWLPSGARRGEEGICPSRQAELRAQLARIGPLAAERIDLAGFADPLFILHTANFQWLLDNAVYYDPEQDHMPYWAEIWPSSIVLADVVSRNQEALTALNGLLQTGREPRTLRVNWRTPTGEIFKVAGKGFAVILASDVLYETKDVRPSPRRAGRGDPRPGRRAVDRRTRARAGEEGRQGAALAPVAPPDRAVPQPSPRSELQHLGHHHRPPPAPPI